MQYLCVSHPCIEATKRNIKSQRPVRTCLLQHVLLRTYATLHVAAMYLAAVAALPGLGDRLRGSLPEPALAALGLWDPPAPGRSIAPALGLLLLVCAGTGVGGLARFLLIGRWSFCPQRPSLLDRHVAWHGHA